MSTTHSAAKRITDAGAPGAQTPILGVSAKRLVSLKEAIEFAASKSPHLASALHADCTDAATLAAGAMAITRGHSKEACDLLPEPELRGAIVAYTLPSPFYEILNAVLRSEDRTSCIPYFPFLKLIHTAITALPSPPAKLTVYRGVKLNLRDDYPKGRDFYWWQLTSATGTLDALRDPQFLGTSGDRTMFIIETCSPRSVNHFSAVPHEDEWLIPCGCRFIVHSVLDAGNGLTQIQLKEIKGSPLLEELSLASPPIRWFCPSCRRSNTAPPSVTTCAHCNYTLSALNKVEELDATDTAKVPPSSLWDYPLLKKLNVKDRSDIADVNHLTLLEELDASRGCGIADAGFSQLRNIKKLNATNNEKITTVNHLSLLEDLDASRADYRSESCGITDAGLSQLRNIKKLNAFANKAITTVNHLTLLEELVAGSSCGIDDAGFAQVRNIKSLDASDNKKITTVNHLTLLEDLDASGSCRITDAGLSKLLNIRKLNASGNKRITNVNHLPLLEDLNVSGWRCGVADAGLRKLRSVKKLNARENEKITTVNHLRLLEELDASEENGTPCGITDAGISQLRNIKKLVASNNDKITTVNHLHLLEDLDAFGSCGITDIGLSQLRNIKKLQAGGNKKITTVNHLQLLEELLAFTGQINSCQMSFSGIDDAGLSQLRNIKKLYACGNESITNVNHLMLLEELDASQGEFTSCGISSAGLSQLRNIKKLEARNNEKITTVNHLQLLEDLDAFGSCGITDIGLSQLRNIKKLNASNNEKITTVNHLQLLEDLDAFGSCGISDVGLSQLRNIKKLQAGGNKKITTVNHLQLLEELHAFTEEINWRQSSCSGIDDAGLSQLRNIKKLNAYGNATITNVNHLMLLEELDAGGRCGIDDAGISQLRNIKKINAIGNGKIAGAKDCVMEWALQRIHLCSFSFSLDTASKGAILALVPGALQGSPAPS